jgi:pyruvate kinase
MGDFARKRTKIVATVGPASRDPATLRALLRAGVDVVRLNFSHGSHAEHGATIDDVRRIARELDRPIAILQDLPGPKVRTGKLAGGVDAILLEKGATFSLTTEHVAGTASVVGVSYPGLARDVTPGAQIYLADGALVLTILDTNATTIRTRVEVGGLLRGEQGINYPDGTLGIATVTPRDFEHLAFGLERGVDWVAVSFVRAADDVLSVKRFIAERGQNVPVMAKIEKHEALDSIEEILAAADGLMVARGDLGIEIPLEQVPLAQKDLIARANRASKPVVTATQMLESMITSPRPTRAETTDVANAIIDGTDAVMLSAETARGAYPIEAVRVMATIALEVERHYPHALLHARRVERSSKAGPAAIAQSAVHVSAELGLGVIVCGTATGATAATIASFRPRARVVALTLGGEVARRLNVVWGVDARVVPPFDYFEELVTLAEEHVLRDGVPGENEFVLTAGMPIGTGTNVLKIHRLDDSAT